MSLLGTVLLQASLAAASASAPSSTTGASSSAPEGLRDQYQSALLKAIRTRWDTLRRPSGTDCHVILTQIPGGTVIRVEYQTCSLDSPMRAQFDAAIVGFELPYKGFEIVFSRKIAARICSSDCQ